MLPLVALSVQMFQMSTPENDLVPSVSPSITSRDSVARLSRATPELMNVSPLSGNIPDAESQQKSVQELLQQRQWLHSQRNQLKSQIDAVESGAFLLSPMKWIPICKNI